MATLSDVHSGRPDTALPTCVHAMEGLCRTCQEAYDDDPEAWIEFGDHPAGIARWHAFLQRLPPDFLEVRYATIEHEAELPY